MAGIVVGVDGSPGSAVALDWAMRTAAGQGVPLTVLAVHQVLASQWTPNPVILPADARAAADARLRVKEMVEKAASNLGTQPPAVAIKVVSGLAASELIGAAEHADLIVVGSRGHGGFGSLMVGSVSDQVVHHAKCPVVVVPFER